MVWIMEVLVYLAQRGASVVAFDYSKKMIELAKRRQSQYAKQIEFCVADATDRKSILELKRNRAFTKAVSNMAIMDITDIEPLLRNVSLCGSCYLHRYYCFKNQFQAK